MDLTGPVAEDHLVCIFVTPLLEASDGSEVREFRYLTQYKDVRRLHVSVLKSMTSPPDVVERFDGGPQEREALTHQPFGGHSVPFPADPFTQLVICQLADDQ